jgi:hypothetical protein
MVTTRGHIGEEPSVGLTLVRLVLLKCQRVGTVGSSILQVTSKGPMCLCINCSGSIEGPKNQFGSRSLKIQDREVVRIPRRVGG